jgi:hypothetical protein
VCARGDGIRGSKDLRAEIGKFPNSTNERKQMSTKTMKQRIAVVAVSALTAGLFSVVSTPSANAALNVAPGTTTPAAAAGVMNVATTKNVGGSAVITADTTASSVGLINVSDISGGLQPGTTQTAVLLSTGTLVVTSLASATAANSNDTVVYTVENGVISGMTSGDGFNSARTVGVCSEIADECVAAITPNAGATTMTVRMYNGAMATYATDGSATEAEAVAAALATPTLGTLKGQLTVTIAAASTAGTIAAAKSGVYYVSTYSASNTATSDTAGLGSASAVSKQYGAVRIRDTYSTAVDVGGLFQISATNGALVALADSVGTASTAFSTSVADGQGFAVSNPTNNPLSTTVTVSYNGTVIGTKTFAFWGEVAKVTLSEPVIGKQGVTTGNTAKLSLADAAGNPIYFDYSGASTFTPASGLLSSAASGRTTTLSTTPAIDLTTGVVTGGKVKFACATTTTSSTAQVQYVNNSGTVITSNLLPITCAGTAVTFKASYDKAVYAPGELAKLTVSFFDSKGNKAQAIDNPTAVAITASTSGLGSAVIAPAINETITDGTVSYLFPVGVNEGSFVNTVVAATVNTAAAAANLTATDAATVTITVKASSATVTNAEVLKSIVALIASINKQIQALQKLILKR